MCLLNPCRIGGRAAKACEVLHGLGFKQVLISLAKINSQKFKTIETFNLQARAYMGSFEEWKQRGGTIETD